MPKEADFIGLPPQQLSYTKKNKEWRKKHLDWADRNSYLNHSYIRNTIRHKKINYDLINGKLHMHDLAKVLNPDGIEASYIPDEIQHYPIMNSKLNVLRGEEIKRPFDFRVVVTNPNSISEIEEAKKQQVLQVITELVQNTAQSEEEAQQELQRINEEFTYDWQDLREIRSNELINHYSKEQDFKTIFNSGFMDAMTVGEEIYRCSIVSGEPLLERLNPLKVKVFKSGYSNKIEDADIITIEDYWSLGKIIDTFYEHLSEKEVKRLENLLSGKTKDSSEDPNDYFVKVDNGDGLIEDTDMLFTPSESSDSLSPYDTAGNIRVLQVYWKSRRKIKKVKSYNVDTGEEVEEFYPEDYIINESLGEEETIYWINEAWEGTKIGDDVYVCMRPRPIQYNRLNNPSRCHFGIIGNIYNFNDSKPFSLVDMMKRYNYLYDALHDKLNKTLHKNWGMLVNLDLAKVPEGWNIDQWMHYAKVAGIVVTDSFREGQIGAATGKLAGGLNNASTGVINAESGNSIQHLINTLEYIKNEMSEVAGISRQREGQISNRETVGGVERATLQSSHITEWLFSIHENLKKRVVECFIETAKIAMKGTNKKFQYLLSDNSMRIMDIDGDEFADNDYGLIIDNTTTSMQLDQRLDMLAQAALQNQLLNFSSIINLYTTSSISEKINIIRKGEKAMQKTQQEAQQQAMQMQQEQLKAQQEQVRIQMEHQTSLNERDNNTKIEVAKIQSEAQIKNQQMSLESAESIAKYKADVSSETQISISKDKLRREDEKLDLEEKSYARKVLKDKQELSLKRQALRRTNNK